MNKIWSVMIIVSFVLGIFSGNIENIVNVLFDSAKQAVSTCVELLGMICMWSGFMKIAENSGILGKISNIISPITNFLFPELPKKCEAKNHIAMNITANILGLGNVATPMGLKAMEEMQKYNEKKETATNSMIMLMVLNTASIQLIPTTIIALRASYNSQNPAIVVIPILLASIASVVIGIGAVKAFTKTRR